MISKEAKEWLKSINNRSGIKPSSEVIEYFRQFCPDFPVTIYRGVWFRDFEEFSLKTKMTKFPNKVGSKLSNGLGIHWTFNQSIAAEFASGPGQFGLLIEAVVDPEDIIVDLDALPSELREELEWLGENEIILKSSPSECKVIGFMAPKDHPEFEE